MDVKKMTTTELDNELNSIDHRLAELDKVWDENDRKCVSNYSVSKEIDGLNNRKEEINTELAVRSAEQERKSIVISTTSKVYKRPSNITPGNPVTPGGK